MLLSAAWLREMVLFQISSHTAQLAACRLAGCRLLQLVGVTLVPLVTVHCWLLSNLLTVRYLLQASSVFCLGQLNYGDLQMIWIIWIWASDD